MVPNQHTKLELIQAQVTFIPDGWKLDQVGNALNIRNNFRKPISQEVRSTMQGSYPYYGPTKIQDYISDYEQDGIYALIGEDGDHFLKYSTMRQTQFISGRCTVNNHAHIIESSKECDSEWFYIFFKHRNITNFLSRQGAGRFKLNKATLEKLPLLVPPIGEQQKIAKVLSAWDKAISTTERQIDNSKQQKKALMQQLLTGKKRLFDDSGKPFDGEWEEVRLVEITEFIKDGTHGTHKRYEKGVPMLSAANITKNHKINFEGAPNIREEDYKKIHSKYEITRGDILLTVVGTLGRVAIFSGSEKFTLQRSVAIIRVSEKASNHFMMQLFSSRDFNNTLIRKSNSTAQAGVYLGELSKVKVLLPSLLEQKKIATVLTNADNEIELLEQQLADLKQEKKALMQQLLTGKRRVSV